MARSIVPFLRRAVMLSVASACGTNGAEAPEGGVDAGNEGADEQALADAPVDAPPDVSDATLLPEVAPLPLPDGCVLTGKPDVFLPCGYSEIVNDPTLCGVDPTVDGGVQDASVCFALCDPTEPDCTYFAYTNSDGSVLSLLNCGMGCIGRLHDQARRDADRCASGARGRTHHWARAAALEAASVEAFALVADALTRFGAPDELVAGAHRAATEEVDHARRTRALAGAFSDDASPPARAPRRVPGLRGFALENAVEGCVRETFGAALALWQSLTSTDEQVRDTMRVLARDEAGHADLAWRIDAWLGTVLTASDRRAVAQARARAVTELRASLADFQADAVLGWPSATQASALFDAIASVFQTTSL